MFSFSSNDFVRCALNATEGSEDPDPVTSTIEAFFSFAEEIDTYYAAAEKLCSENEKQRARKFHNISDRTIYLFSHGLLRSILSKKLSTDPTSIQIINDDMGKPFLKTVNLFFNISHSKHACAIAVSEKGPMGIDIEKIETPYNLKSLVRNYFSRAEQNFVSLKDGEKLSRFFQIWTRKEALLKAMGSGIISDLTKIEVLGRDSNIDNEITPELIRFSGSFNTYFIYSRQIRDYYISLAMPFRARIISKDFNLEEARIYFG